MPKNIIITGASKGIGKALALGLAKEGANLSLVARSHKELEQIQQEIQALDAKVLIFAGSVSDENLADKVVSDTLAAFGSIDVVINNAGFGIFGAAETISEKDWNSVFETNVKGTFLFSKAVIPAMKEAQKGHIINIASDVAKRVFEGGSLYCASKYAQDAFSMALRKEVRKHGIKVSVVYSGLVDTMFHERPQGDPHHADWLKCTDMVNAILFVINQPPHVVIDELMIHPLSQEY